MAQCLSRGLGHGPSVRHRGASAKREIRHRIAQGEIAQEQIVGELIDRGQTVGKQTVGKQAERNLAGQDRIAQGLNDRGRTGETARDRTREQIATPLR